jgi:hypothetical protein
MQTWIGTCAAGKKRATTRRHGLSSWTSRSGPGLVRAQPQRGGSEQALTSSIGQREPVDRPRFVRPTVTSQRQRTWVHLWLIRTMSGSSAVARRSTRNPIQHVQRLSPRPAFAPVATCGQAAAGLEFLAPGRVRNATCACRKFDPLGSGPRIGR